MSETGSIQTGWIFINPALGSSLGVHVLGHAAITSTAAYPLYVIGVVVIIVVVVMFVRRGDR